MAADGGRAPPQALLLGCDGVLVLRPAGKDAARRAAHLTASREAAAAFGLTLSDADFARMAGVPPEEAFSRLAAEQGRVVDGAAAAAAKAAAQRLHSSGLPFASAIAFAREAAGAGAALGVVSEARADHVAAVLAKTGLASAVRAVAARDAAPDATGRLAAAAAALGVPLSACHVMECTDAALAAATAAGCCGVTDARALPGYAAAAVAAAGPPQAQPAQPAPRLRGRVKSYSNTHAYGFIADAGGGADAFVHQTDICKPGHRCLEVGEEVEFYVELVAGKPRARKVTPLGVAPWADRPSKGKGKGKGEGGVQAGGDGAARRVAQAQAQAAATATALPRGAAAADSAAAAMDEM